MGVSIIPKMAEDEKKARDYTAVFLELRQLYNLTRLQAEFRLG